MLRLRARPARAARFHEEPPPGASARTAALLGGAAAGAGLALLGLRILRSTAGGTPWVLRPPSVPDAGWSWAWGASASGPARVQAEALADLLGASGVLALCLVVAAMLGLVLALATELDLRASSFALRRALGATCRQLRREAVREGTRLALLATGPALVLAMAGRLLLLRTWPGPVDGASEPLPMALPGLPVLALLGAAVLLLVPLPWLLGPRYRCHVRRVLPPARPTRAVGWGIPPAQVALAVVLSVCAPVLARVALPGAGVGAPGEAARSADTLILRVRLPEREIGPETWDALSRQLRERTGARVVAAATPGAFLGLGVEDRVATRCSGCGSGGLGVPVAVGRARHLGVGADYFAVLQVSGGSRVRSGARAGSVSVDSAFARSLLPAGDGAGTPVWLHGSIPFASPYARVGDVRDPPRLPVLGEGARPTPRVFVPLAIVRPRRADLALLYDDGRTWGERRSQALRALAAIRPGAGVEPLGTLAWLAREQLAQLRWLGRVAAVLALASLLLAVRGVTATAADRVRERRSEIALRRAVGARRRDIARLMMADAVPAGLAGATAGVALGWIAGDALQSAVAGVRAPGTALLVSMALVAFLLTLVCAGVVGWREAGRAPASGL